MRRFIVLLAAAIAVLAGALTAQAATSHSAPQQAPRPATASRAVHAASAQLTMSMAAAKRGAAQAFQIHAALEHTAHLAHTAHAAHTAHLARLASIAHAAHLAQLAAHQAHLARLAAHQSHLAHVLTAARHPVTPAPSAAAVHESSTAASAPASSAPATYSGSGGFQSCVISRESGGNSQVMNASGHYGLYQFDVGTWASGGGNPADFGHASVTEQNQVFASVYAARGTSPWSPSDGC